ncbi:hypothetical protein SJC10_43 [Bacteroides phage SJC10]|nr:hypothetical protein SJC10_43 [Bacteroides phage SJC10]
MIEREDLRRCAICGKDVPFIHPGEVVINVDGKAVCPVCERKVAKLHEWAEEHRKAIGHTKKEETAAEYIERLDRERKEKELQELRDQNAKAARAFDDLKEEYESFRERTSRVWWGIAIAGVLIGSLFH